MSEPSGGEAILLCSSLPKPLWDLAGSHHTVSPPWSPLFPASEGKRMQIVKSMDSSPNFKGGWGMGGEQMGHLLSSPCHCHNILYVYHISHGVRVFLQILAVFWALLIWANCHFNRDSCSFCHHVSNGGAGDHVCLLLEGHYHQWEMHIFGDLIPRQTEFLSCWGDPLHLIRQWDLYNPLSSIVIYEILTISLLNQKLGLIIWYGWVRLLNWWNRRFEIRIYKRELLFPSLANFSNLMHMRGKFNENPPLLGGVSKLLWF